MTVPAIDERFFKPDPLAMGSKGLVYIGDRVVVYRRDNKTTVHPLELDLPGGGPEPIETPFETFQREVREEINLPVQPGDIVYCVRRPSQQEPGKFFYFPVAKLPASLESEVKLGNEGKELTLMPPSEFVSASDAWPILRELTEEYLHSL